MCNLFVLDSLGIETLSWHCNNNFVFFCLYWAWRPIWSLTTASLLCCVRQTEVSVCVFSKVGFCPTVSGCRWTLWPRVINAGLDVRIINTFRRSVLQATSHHLGSFFCCGKNTQSSHSRWNYCTCVERPGVSAGGQTQKKKSLSPTQYITTAPYSHCRGGKGCRDPSIYLSLGLVSCCSGNKALKFQNKCWSLC